MSSLRSRNSTVQASTTGFRISATIPDGPSALPEAILWMTFWSSTWESARLCFQLGFPLTGLNDSTVTPRWGDVHNALFELLSVLHRLATSSECILLLDYYSSTRKSSAGSPTRDQGITSLAGDTQDMTPLNPTFYMVNCPKHRSKLWGFIRTASLGWY